MTIKLKRAYSPPEPDDGKRYLVDRLWPRGIRKEALQLTAWLKDLAPSTSLRRWYGHVPERWREFQARYKSELEAPQPHALLEDLAREAKSGAVTLVYAAKDEERNEAVVLKDLLDAMQSR